MLDQYTSYLDSVASLLPADAIRLEQEFTLHDSELADLYLTIQDASAILKLDGFNVEHRMLFSTGAQLTIRFKNLKLQTA